MTLLRRARPVLLAGLFTSCSTIATLIGGAHPERYDCSDGRFVPRIYSGVFSDVASLKGGTGDPLLLIWDLPFSLVADTLVLPYTIYAQIRFGNLCPRPGEPAGVPANEPATQ